MKMKTCPKCDDEMAPLPVAVKDGQLYLIAQPISELSLPNEALALTAFCCCHCGFVELYAGEEIMPPSLASTPRA